MDYRDRGYAGARISPVQKWPPPVDFCYPQRRTELELIERRTVPPCNARGTLEQREISARR